MDKGSESYRKFLNGDPCGMSEIVRAYKDGLIYYINSFLRDIHAAEDVTEDVFLKLMIKKPRDRGDAAFKTWLYAVARNEALNHLRRRKREEPCEEVDAGAEEWDYLSGERRQILDRAMSELTRDQRQVIALVYFEGFSVKESAKIMHRSAHATEALISRARFALRQQLLKEGFDYEEL